MKTVCKDLRSFTVPILRKIYITNDFNGPKMEWRLFFKFHQVIPLIVVDNLHYRLFQPEVM